MPNPTHAVRPVGAVRPVKSPDGASGRWTVLAICCLSLFLVGLDTTIVNVGLPSIGAGLHIGTRGLEWTVDAYTLVMASLLISSGALADRVGRRRVFRLGLVVFGVASVVCALAPGFGVLVAARAVQGVGASMLSPVALAIVVNVMTDPRERARAIGVWAAVFGVSMAAGPLVGGALVSAVGWRSLFWINVPVVLVALALTAFFVPESRAERPRRLDGPGQLLLTVVVGSSVAVLIEGPRVGWGSPLALTGYAVVIGAAVAFGWVESRRAEPLVDPRLFLRRPFAAAVVGAVAVFVALSATLLLNTLYLQHGRGMTPLAAGVVTLPMAVAATVCAPLSGVLVGRFGPRPPLVLAGVFTTAGGLCLVGLDDHTDLRWPALAYLLVGIGFGCANAPLTHTAVSGLPPARAGVAGGITSTARQLGSALGIAAAGSLIAGAAPAQLARASRPGWFLVAACGLLILAVAALAPSARARRDPRPVGRPAGHAETEGARTAGGRPGRG
ncbi:MFS transporter [Streptomyces sp. NPDC051315]|uniref:MFS transporter n=1 Tax=Streptomyces sp. NPDC051315 TaxID=3365650 RepID=UPI00379144A9